MQVVQTLRTPSVVRPVPARAEPGPLAALADARAGRDRLAWVALAAADLLAALAAIVLSALVVPDGLGGIAAVLAPPVVVATAKLLGLYRREELVIGRSTAADVPAHVHHATLCALVLALAASTAPDEPVTASAILVLWPALLVGTIALRVVARAAVAWVTPPERLLAVGDVDACARVAAALALDDARAVVVGSVVLEDVCETAGGVRRPDDGLLAELVAALDVHRVLVVPSRRDPDLSLEVLRALQAGPARVSVAADVLGVVGAGFVVEDIAGVPVLGVRRFALSATARAAKRALDLAGALAGLVVLSPALLLIAVAIKVDSPGPVLFRQERVGRGGRRFRIFKFRTMVHDAEERKAELVALNEAAAGFFKIRDDPRITRVGRLLRRACLDELAQLLNVVRGDMSLVGPRPLIVAEDRTIHGHDRRRLELKPGMTGRWQIVGSSRASLEDMVRMDWLYISSWSLLGDLRILARTALYVALRRGM